MRNLMHEALRERWRFLEDLPAPELNVLRVECADIVTHHWERGREVVGKHAKGVLLEVTLATLCKVNAYCEYFSKELFDLSVSVEVYAQHHSSIVIHGREKDKRGSRRKRNMVWYHDNTPAVSTVILKGHGHLLPPTHPAELDSFLAGLRPGVVLLDLRGHDVSRPWSASEPAGQQTLGFELKVEPENPFA